MKPISIYIHIPFCVKKCSYCDFASYAGKFDLVEDYFDHLYKELKKTLEAFPLEIKTLFIGGGTPTTVALSYYQSLMKILAPYMLKDCEASIEANPGTITLEYLKGLKALGFNRLSIGAQSFNPHELALLGRIHTKEEIVRSFNESRKAGFTNINLDLMFALPEQTLESWISSLDQAIDLSPEHISAYNLQLEEGTPLFDTINKKGALLRKANQEIDLEMYETLLQKMAKANYKHYEISNFAKDGFECRHNMNYWLNGNYIGFGSGAHSHMNGARWENPKAIEEYLAKTYDPSPFGRGVRSEGSGETIFLGLRLIEGIPLSLFDNYKEKLDKLIGEGFLKISNGKVSFTKKGLLLGNLVFEEFVE
ncbi:MAG: Oxygen-independent coproporphyrinogen III oxidase [Candidatus Giovannonibacteria bacterium GW2011_GWC2_43_8]|nr:MAG: Oxygen-independent coproporphyrinogen III oxidase [Candidatus Giovannonibacteria bacterium GW2011_GWC2_43_8]